MKKINNKMCPQKDIFVPKGNVPKRTKGGNYENIK